MSGKNIIHWNGKSTKEINLELKEQALAHWKDNLDKLHRLDWDNWCFISKEHRYRAIFYHVPDVDAPYIDGDVCPFCNHYCDNGSNCVTDDEEECPIHDTLPEHDTGGCCIEWEAVRRSLMYPAETKDQAIEAIENMIRKLEAIDG